MSIYQELKGLKVKFLDSATSGDRAIEGEVFYNSAGPNVATHVSTGAWSAGTILPAAKRLTAGFGTQTAAISAGGSPIVDTAFEYNGFGWAALASMNDAKHSFDGVGTSTAGLVCGGVIGSPAASNRTNQSEEWDGSSWTEGDNMNSSRSDSHAAGLQTAAVSAFGVIGTSRTNKTEEYNGSSWSEVTNAPASLDGNRGSGTLTAGIFTGGDIPARQTTTFLYDGTNWTTGTAMPQALSKHGASGTQTAALVFGGASPAADAEVDAAVYDGTTWTQSGDMATGRQELNGADASNTASLAIGGELQPGNSNAVEEWNFSILTTTAAAWASGNAVNQIRRVGAGTGTQTSGMIFGGLDAATALGHTEQYDGTNWTEVGDLNTARGKLGSATAGSQTAALGFGGSTAEPSNPAIVDNSEEFNGSSWAEGDNINTARYNIAGAGTQTAGIGFGGYTTSTNRNESEEYNGTSWTEGDNLNTARGYIAGGGIQTAALAATGFIDGGGGKSAVTEEYNGTSWTNVTSCPTEQAGAILAGTQTNAIIFAGSPNRATTFGYDGTNWSTRPSMATGRDFSSGFGTATAALCAGGNGGSPGDEGLGTVEEFTGDTQAASAKTIDFD